MNDITNSNIKSHHMKPPVWLEVKQKAGGGQQTALRVQEEREQLRQKLEQQSHKRNQVPRGTRQIVFHYGNWLAVYSFGPWKPLNIAYCLLRINIHSEKWEKAPF